MYKRNKENTIHNDILFPYPLGKNNLCKRTDNDRHFFALIKKERKTFINFILFIFYLIFRIIIFSVL
jgi:hypothetical protein